MLRTFPPDATFFNVLDYGAVGDGVADDAPAIQSALEAANTAGGGTVYIPAGKFLLGNHLYVRAGTTLRGVNEVNFVSGSPISLAANVGTVLLLPAAFNIYPYANACLCGLTIIRAGMTFPAADTSLYTGNPIYIQGNDVTIQGCQTIGYQFGITVPAFDRFRITDFATDCLYGVVVSGAATAGWVTRATLGSYGTDGGAGSAARPNQGLYVTSSSGIIFDACNVTGSNQGSYVNGCTNILFKGCTFNGLNVAGAYGTLVQGTNSQIHYTGCSFQNWTIGWWNQSAGTYISDCLAFNNSSSGFRSENGPCTMRDCISMNASNGFQTVTGLPVTITGCKTIACTIPIAVSAATTGLLLNQDNDFGDAAAGTDCVTTLYTLPILASAASIALPVNGDCFLVSGVAAITSLTGAWSGRLITLMFQSTATMVDSGAAATIYQANLVGAKVGSAESTLVLRHNGTHWVEISRSAP